MDRDAITSFKMTEGEIYLAKLLRTLIDDGTLSTARFVLAMASPETRYRIARPNKDPPLEPALLFAIETGSVEFVKLLVDECGVNFNKEIEVDGRFFYNPKKWMSPLEIAIWTSAPDIAEYLVSLGADIDSLSKDPKTIFRACNSGSPKTIQILVNHGADVNASNEDGNTCLMRFVRDVDLCRFLINNGADVNKVNNRGNTALHWAAEANCHLTTKLLIENGSDVSCKNENEFDALEIACLCGCVDTVDVLIKTAVRPTDVIRQIETYQLLGSSLVARGFVPTALSAWRTAIELSSKHGIATSETTLHTSLGVVVEATTLSELDELSKDRDQLNMQCVLLIHKLLGSTHVQYFYAISMIMDQYFNAGSYARWLSYFIYYIEMTQNPDLGSLPEIERILSCLNGSIDRLDKLASFPLLRFDLVYEFMSRIVGLNVTSYTHSEVTESLMNLMFDGALMCYYYAQCYNEHVLDSHNLMRSAIKTSAGRKLLIHALKSFESSQFRMYFPHQGLITMLLECGADVNERDEGGNNVLHILMGACMESRNSGIDDDDDALLPTNEIVKTLALKFVENGIHLDARNHQGLVATSFLKRAGINVVPPINLMCSAARAIHRHKIPYEKILPRFFIDFVRVH